MPKNITITDIVFDTARIWSVPDPAGGPLHIWVGVGFDYIIDGQRLRGERTIELAGARRTQVVTFFSNIKADILALEGI